MLANQIMQNLNNWEYYWGLNNSCEKACHSSRIGEKKKFKKFCLEPKLYDVKLFSRCQKWHCSVARKILKKIFHQLMCWMNISELVWMVPIASFRNGSYFDECGSVFPLDNKWWILSIFYWVAPNYYDVFLILLMAPFIDFY